MTAVQSTLASRTLEYMTRDLMQVFSTPLLLMPQVAMSRTKMARAKTVG